MQRQEPGRAKSNLEEAKRRFDAWRRSHRWLGRVPNELWRLAAETAAVHGVEATARRLLVDPARLKQWLPVVHRRRPSRSGQDPQRDHRHQAEANRRSLAVQLAVNPIGPERPFANRNIGISGSMARPARG